MKTHTFFVTCHRYHDEEVYADFFYKPSVSELLNYVANAIQETSIVKSGKKLTPSRLYEVTEVENLTIGMEGLDGETDEVIDYLEGANV